MHSQWPAKCVVAMTAWLLAISSSWAQPKERVFLVPAGAQVHDKPAKVEGNNEVHWIKAGGVVTAKVNAGFFFVDAGGSLAIEGNGLRIIVAQGGSVTSLDGNVVHIYKAKGAKIGKTRASLEHVSTHDAITIQQVKPFTVSGIAKNADGKPAAGVKVHAYTLGSQLL